MQSESSLNAGCFKKLDDENTFSAPTNLNLPLVIWSEKKSTKLFRGRRKGQCPEFDCSPVGNSKTVCEPLRSSRTMQTTECPLKSNHLKEFKELLQKAWQLFRYKSLRWHFQGSNEKALKIASVNLLKEIITTLFSYH